MKKMGSSVHLLEWDDAFQDGYRLTHSNASFTSNKPYNLISINNEGKIISLNPTIVNLSFWLSVNDILSKRFQDGDNSGRATVVLLVIYWQLKAFTIGPNSCNGIKLFQKRLVSILIALKYSFTH